VSDSDGGRHPAELPAEPLLGIQKLAASNRHVRALKRLKDVLSAMPGFFEL